MANWIHSTITEQCVALWRHLVGLAKQAASQRAIVSYTTTAEWVERAAYCCSAATNWDYIQPAAVALASASQFSALLFSKHPYLMGAMYIQKRPVFPYRQSPENFGTAKTINREDMCVHWRNFFSPYSVFYLQMFLFQYITKLQWWAKQIESKLILALFLPFWRERDDHRFCAWPLSNWNFEYIQWDILKV